MTDQKQAVGIDRMVFLFMEKNPFSFMIVFLWMVRAFFAQALGVLRVEIANDFMG